MSLNQRGSGRRLPGRVSPLGLQEKLFLGNLDAKRYWGHAKDFIRAMWLMLQPEISFDELVTVMVREATAAFFATENPCF